MVKVAEELGIDLLGKKVQVMLFICEKRIKEEPQSQGMAKSL